MAEFNAPSPNVELSSDSRFAIPLLDQLVPDGLEPGTVFTAEFDPDSQWLAIATTIAARYLQAGGRVSYGSVTRPPEAVKRNLAKFGVDVPAVVKEQRLCVDDWYTATLTGGRIASEQEKGAFLEPIEGAMIDRSRYRSREVCVSSL